MTNATERKWLSCVAKWVALLSMGGHIDTEDKRSWKFLAVRNIWMLGMRKAFLGSFQPSEENFLPSLNFIIFKFCYLYLAHILGVLRGFIWVLHIALWIKILYKISFGSPDLEIRLLTAPVYRFQSDGSDPNLGGRLTDTVDQGSLRAFLEIQFYLRPTTWFLFPAYMSLFACEFPLSEYKMALLRKCRRMCQ